MSDIFLCLCMHAYVGISMNPLTDVYITYSSLPIYLPYSVNTSKIMSTSTPTTLVLSLLPLGPQRCFGTGQQNF